MGTLEPEPDRMVRASARISCNVFLWDFSMKLNDPFGRLEMRHQSGYEAMRDGLRSSGVNTPEAAQEVMRQTKKRAIKYIGVGLAVLLSMMLLLPKLIPVTASLALFLVVWVVNSALNGRRYIERYIKEDLS